MRYTRTLLLVQFHLSSSVLYTEKRNRERAKGERESALLCIYSQILWVVKIQLKRSTLLHIHVLLYKNLTPFLSYLLKQQARKFLLVIIHFALLAASFNSSCYIGGYYRSRRTRRSPRGLNLLRRTRTSSETLPGSSRPRNLHPQKTRCCCFFRRRTLLPGLSSRSRSRWRTSAL